MANKEDQQQTGLVKTLEHHRDRSALEVCDKAQVQGVCIMIIIIADVLLKSLNDYCCCMDITGL